MTIYSPQTSSLSYFALRVVEWLISDLLESSVQMSLHSVEVWTELLLSTRSKRKWIAQLDILTINFLIFRNWTITSLNRLIWLRNICLVRLKRWLAVWALRYEYVPTVWILKSHILFCCLACLRSWWKKRAKFCSRCIKFFHVTYIRLSGLI